jgi:AAA15 family ATPase/GTPase
VDVSLGDPMIVSFSVSNFRSFASEETFSLTASNRLSGSHDSHAVPIPDSDQKVLRAGVIYGANGAGKSNLFNALRYVKSVALSRREKGSGVGREAFRLGGTAEEPSSFDLQFIVGNKLYRFGFKTDDQRISEEWLVRIIDRREKILYERITDLDGNVKVDAAGLKEPNGKLTALATIGGPQNQSFLATVNVTLETSDYGEELGEVLNWFRHSLQLIGPGSSFARLGHYFANNPGCVEFAGSFLKSVSTGVDHLEVSKKEITEEDLRGLLPDDLISEVLKGVQKEDDGTALVKLSEGNELFIERAPENHYYRITIRSAHESIKGEFVPFDIVDESDGTRRLLNLMPALHALKTSDTVYVIDEIDRSLHPNLVREFLGFFLKSCSGCRAQIIVTTHESNLLDLELLRRDEIWFAETDQGSATRLYSLTDFRVRTDLDIRKHYLQGRFGAVPFLGDIDRLREGERQTA